MSVKLGKKDFHRQFWCWDCFAFTHFLQTDEKNKSLSKLSSMFLLYQIMQSLKNTTRNKDLMASIYFSGAEEKKITLTFHIWLCKTIKICTYFCPNLHGVDTTESQAQQTQTRHLCSFAGRNVNWIGGATKIWDRFNAISRIIGGHSDVNKSFERVSRISTSV